MAEGGSFLQVVRFGAFEVDLRAGELRKHGLKIKLQEQPLQVLALLLERPGQLVTREELKQKLWPAYTFVDFDHSLNTAINKLREALDDSADTPHFIETLPRRGYRFIYPLEKPEAAIFPQAGAWGLGAGVALIVVAALLLGLNVGGLRDRIFGAAGAERIGGRSALPEPERRTRKRLLQ